MGQVGVNLSKISAIQNEDQNHDRDRDAEEFKENQLVTTDVAGVKGPLKNRVPSNYVKIAFPNLVNSSLMSVFLLRMLEENGRLIALYDPKMGHLSKSLGRGWGLPHPKIQMANGTKYKHVILLQEITHDSEKITKTSKRNNTYAIRQQQYNSFTKKKTYFDGDLEVYDVFSRQTCKKA